MKKQNQYKAQLLQCFFVSALASSTYVYAEPGVLEDVPLSIGTYVQPNILFLVDDSGSMDWEILKSEGANDIYSSNRNSGNVDYTPSASNRLELLESCSAYNVMYYDPERIYTPWIGLNQNGIAYENIEPTNAPTNPYYADSYVDLTQLQSNGDIAGYIASQDLDGDGEFDVGDCFDDGTTNAEMYANFVSITSMTADEKINLANWFSYYRKREFVVKRALSEVIDNNTSRVGLATLHNNNDVGIIIKDIDNVNPEDTTTANANKNALLKKLFEINSNGSTPLRRALNNAGLYFTEGKNPSTDFFGSLPDHTGTNTVSTDSPILHKDYGGSCQQNFNILFSDGEWNGGSPSGIDNADGDNNTLYDGGNFADTYSRTLADVAMHYLENDLSSTLSDSLNVTDIRQTNVPIKHQHMTSYMVAFGVKGTFSDDANDTSISGDAGGANDPSSPLFSGWPQPVNRATKIDDLRHAAWNGRGGYLDAETPDDLIESLSDAVEDIQARTGTATSVSFNSGSINTDTLVYQSQFTTDDWSGDVLAYRFDNDGVIDLNGDNDITVADAIWSASDKLNASLNTSGVAGRNVITFSGVEGVPFEFPQNYGTLLTDSVDGEGTISDRMISDLLGDAPFADDTVDASEQADNQIFGEQVVNYLKGDTTNEVDSNGVGLFRARNNNPLGSFIFSSPQYVGIPNENYPNLIEGVGNEYYQYSNDNITRAPLVFVGGNDGMLHGFDASNDATTGGEEVFAYIPGIMSNDLHSLTTVSTNYAHRAYVDSSPTIADVFVRKNGTGNKEWRTYLVGGLRTGGKGVYVLDVSDPNALAEAGNNVANASKIAVDEFTNDKMGFSFSRPQITRLNDGRWAAIFGNGYNNEGDGKAHLFILYLDNGEYKRIEASEPSVTYLANGSCFDADSNCNGLSSPSLADLNSDHIVDRVYAGDLHGNLWVFDLSSTNADHWGVAFNNGTTAEPLFTACETTTCSVVNTVCVASICTGNNRQPITTKPVIKFHPSRYASATEPNIMVYFGTGQLLATNDNQNTDLQSFYGVWDAGVNKEDGSSDTLTKNNLQQQVFSSSFGVSSETVNFDISDEFGWYVDLALDGDNLFNGARSVNTPILLGDIVFFLISIPDEVVCSGAGTSYLAALNLIDGTQSNFNIFDTDDDGSPDSSMPLTLQNGNVVGIGNIDNKIVTTGSNSDINVEDVNTDSYIPKGRKSWSILH